MSNPEFHQLYRLNFEAKALLLRLHFEAKSGHVGSALSLRRDSKLYSISLLATTRYARVVEGARCVCFVFGSKPLLAM